MYYAPPCARGLIRARALFSVLEAPRRWRALCVFFRLRLHAIDAAALCVCLSTPSTRCGVPRECVIRWRRGRHATHRSVLVASLDVRGCYAALAAHASQLVWFRRLFVVFSAYTYANRLVVIE